VPIIRTRANGNTKESTEEIDLVSLVCEKVLREKDRLRTEQISGGLNGEV
jgi:hypothetical protein